MPLIKRYNDPNTGASIGNACWVIAEVQLDTERNAARIKMATYIGLLEYSAGRTPIDQSESVVTGTAYFQNFENPNLSNAQSYVAGLPTFSGATVV